MNRISLLSFFLVACADPSPESEAPADRALAIASGLAADQTFTARQTITDDAGTHVRLDQRYAGLPVFGGEVIVHLTDAGNTVTGKPLDIKLATTTPAIDHDAALAT